VQVPGGLCDVFIERLLTVAETHGWKPSYDNADEDIYLLRHRGDAAQIAVRDHVVHIDASGACQPEFVAFVEQVKHDLAQEAASVRVMT
jgi:hypothetical protein